MVAQFII